MKNLLFLLAIVLFATSCEKESLVIQEAAQDNLCEDNALTQKLRRLSQFPTTADNIADGTSCFALRLPVTVIANNQTIVVNTTADYQQIRDVFAQHANDTDTVVLQFPVSVIRSDYSQVTLQTQAAFDAAVQDCLGSIELSCIDLVYPIAVKSYDSQYQLAQTFSVADKPALFQLLQNADRYDALSIVYPVDFIAPQGNVLTLNSNTTLEAAIDGFTDECLATFNPEPGAGTISNVLTQGTWYVSYFFRETDQTADYANYDFTFNANGSISVTGTPWATTGSWIATDQGGESILDFTFTSSSLEELEESWIIIEYTATLVKMRYESGGSGTRYFNLTRN